MENIAGYIIQNPENWNSDLENEMYIESVTAHERERRINQFYKNLSESKPCL